MVVAVKQDQVALLQEGLGTDGVGTGGPIGAEVDLVGVEGLGRLLLGGQGRAFVGHHIAQFRQGVRDVKLEEVVAQEVVQGRSSWVALVKVSVVVAWRGQHQGIPLGKVDQVGQKWRQDLIRVAFGLGGDFSGNGLLVSFRVDDD